MTTDAIVRETQRFRSTSVARKRLVLQASLFAALAFSEWLLWLGSAYEQTPWWVAAIFPVFALGAASECFRTSAMLVGRRRLAWAFFGAGYLAFFIAEVRWGFYDSFMGVVLPTPSIGDFFYYCLPICFVFGIWQYRTRTPSTDDAFVQLGNLGIILSATLLMYVFTYADFIRLEESPQFVVVQIGFGILNLAAASFGLIALSLYTWGRERRVMLLVFLGLGFNASGDFKFINDLIGGSYQASSLSSGVILICAALISWAAFEQRQLKDADVSDGPTAESEASAKQWESLLPPLAVAGVLLVALVQRDRITPALIPFVIAAALVFIGSLATRNWWSYRLEGQLRFKAFRSQSALEGSNRELETQNVALRRTKLELEQAQRYLAEHQEQLEELVDERTRELESSRRALHRADRLASLGTLAAGLAHELNNPLGIMQLQAEDALLVRGKKNSEDALRGMLEQLRRCADIVKGVLRFARDEVSQKQAVNLAEIVLRSVSLIDHYASESSIEIECRIETALGNDDSPESFTVLGSAVELEQVMVNLLRNAIEASDRGSRVRVELARFGRLLRLSVVDEGSGMTDETREHAFDPFYTTKRDKGGTGLGLSTAHGIMEQHGGSLQVHSDEGKGTRVTFELALYEES